MEKMIELLIGSLLRYGKVSEERMAEMFSKGEAIIIDGHRQIATMNARLARIEAHLGIVPETPAPQIEDKSNGTR